VSDTPGDPASSSGEILLQDPNRYPDVDRPSLAAWLRRLVPELVPGGASFTARLVGRRAMSTLNREFRGKQGATDVLSFPGEETPEGRHLGDVVICVPVAREQAPDGRLDLELARLLLHGALHCLGYDHETDRGEMQRLESRLRRRWIRGHV